MPRLDTPFDGQSAPLPTPGYDAELHLRPRPSQVVTNEGRTLLDMRVRLNLDSRGGLGMKLLGIRILALGLIASGTLTAGLTTPAKADWDHHGWDHHGARPWGWGPAYYYSPPVYYAPPPVVYAPPPPPVYYAPSPVYYGPPGISFGFTVH